MTRQEFMAEINGYYGGFSNEYVAKKFIQKLDKIAEADLDRLLDWFMGNIQSKWTVDVTTLDKGIESCCIFLAIPKKRCPICNALNGESVRLCTNCGYDFSVPAERYRALLARPEDVKKAFGEIVTGLEMKKKEIEKIQKAEIREVQNDKRI